LYGYDSYSNWLINDNKTEYKYIDPFTNNEINNPYKYNFEAIENEKWFNTFKRLYDNADFVYLKGYDYYFKIDGKWYLIPTFKKAEELGLDIRSQYPEKINPEELRMQPLQESMETLMKQNIIKVIDYVQMDSEQGIGLNPINFSSGYYMLELYLPQADTLKFRRYGAMGVSSELFVYQIPEALGGSKEVFFIEQEPNSLYPDQSFAGFYAIRPKNYKQLPEYRPLLEKQKQLKSRRSFLPNEK
ncbi:hypothetical protein, partial [Bizionia paragorgiae]|uniref:hypothetical protein n=1 Tax=Bizionia paragorgiae TaxID=283786 RepID=UPI00299DE28E